MNNTRSLNSFGVAGVLEENCHVLHSALFSTRDIGRVSDLIAAKLKKLGPDELKLRTLILFSAFEAYRGQGGDQHGDRPLDQPISLECGYDTESVAVSFSFALHTDQHFNPEDLETRLKSDLPANSLEAMLCTLYRNAEGVIIRARMSVRQIEVVSLFKIKAGEFQERTVQSMNLDQDFEGTPSAQEYTDLGDLDYETLLKENKTLPRTPRETPSGAILVRGKVNVDQTVTKIAGQKAEAEKITRITGATEKISDEMVRIASRPIDSKQMSLTIKHAGQLSFQPMRHESASVYQAKIRILEAEIENLKAATKKNADSLADKSGPSTLKKLLGNLMGGGSSSKTTESKIVQSGAASASECSESFVTSDSPDPSDTGDEKEIAKISEKLMNQIETGQFGKMIREAQKDIENIETELGSPKARRWVERLVRALTLEKQKLFERAEKLNTQIKQKEAEFKANERSLRQDIAKHTEVIRHKSMALNHAKNQINQMTLSAKSSHSGTPAAGSDGKQKQSAMMAQKLLQVAKEEALQYRAKVDELRNQISSLQLANKSKGPQAAEFDALQAKFERAMKQIEEFRKTNVNLVDKIAMDNRDRSLGLSTLDLRKRLDGAMKIATRSKAELQEVQSRLDDSKREEIRLNQEVARLTAVMRLAKKNSTPAKAA